MSCEVAALPFEAHANYGPWSIDLDTSKTIYVHKYHVMSSLHNKIEYSESNILHTQQNDSEKDILFEIQNT